MVQIRDRIGKEEVPAIIHSSWHEHLLPLFNKEDMIVLKYDTLLKEKFYPPATDVFNVFRMPLDKIRVVILGQDPYNHGEATGYAFAVAENTKGPGSLRVIAQEILRSNAPRSKQVDINTPVWKTLFHWRQQGVFLLNTALTVSEGQANSHARLWGWFIKEVIKIISVNAHPIWMLWGSKAKEYKKYIVAGMAYSRSIALGVGAVEGINYLLEAAHPAAELYPDSSLRYTGCNHFNLCNEILVKKGLEPIMW